MRIQRGWALDPRNPTCGLLTGCTGASEILLEMWILGPHPGLLNQCLPPQFWEALHPSTQDLVNAQ